MGRVVHFELTAADPSVLTDFLARACGWTREESPLLPGYYLVGTGEGNGIDGAVMRSDGQQQPVIIWLEVDDLMSSLAAVERVGGARAGGVNEIPGQGRVAYVTDPNGTIFGLKEPEGARTG